eukprot:comp17755_c0_seq1/m.17761 comp17755_c0_seq1/g.17761  ORF comp17755_c0_seq1/g.17761 comp17755_c0_seq1/m.17761 type:complete len:334 (-) comp17755_c0_seq1:587-1588(-)
MEAAGIKDRIKYLSLATLIIQNTTLVLLMRYSRTVEGTMYLATTAVVCQEVFKLVVCLFILWRERHYNVDSTLQFLKEEILDKPGETMKLGIPACLYTMQSNLLYLAISNLDAATFQVTYQLKILTTAIFSVMMLGQRLSGFKWLSLFILMFGVALVQLPPDVFSSDSAAEQKTVSAGDTMTGLTAVLIACVSSGFAGIYFEKILKGTGSNIWLRNVQLGLFGFILGMGGVYTTNAEQVAAGGFFQGYSLLVWVVVLINALGGLVIAVVVKYADNILKGFATSLAIIFSSILSIYFFDFRPSVPFVFGAALVIAAVFMYGRPDPKPVPLPHHK